MMVVLRKRRPVLGDFDPAHYVTERRTAGAPDGTEIPLSLVYRKGIRRDGSAARVSRYSCCTAPVGQPRRDWACFSALPTSGA